MGLLRGRQYLGILALFADFVLESGGRPAYEVFQLVRRQDREISVREKKKKNFLKGIIFYTYIYFFFMTV